MGASSNWLSLSKSIGASSAPRKRRKLAHDASPAASSTSVPVAESADLPRNRTSGPRSNATKSLDASLLSDKTIVNGESLGALRSMIYAPQDLESFPEKDRAPGTYIAIDCEMVGVGPDGNESSLARVSVVNYAGAVLLDVFVRQRERVTDWRTQYSGIRPADMVHAKPFEEVQKLVSGLLDGRVLVGHAVHNDLHALMLSHSRAQQRDTQLLAHRHGQSKARHPALRNLAREMLGIAIQEGEHSSVIDARATMAIYRLHRKQWDRPFNTASFRVKSKSEGPAVVGGKRKHDPQDDDERDDVSMSAKEVKVAKSGAVQRKGTSSGLTTIVKNSAKSMIIGGSNTPRQGTVNKTKWWKDLSGGTTAVRSVKGSKASIRVRSD